MTRLALAAANLLELISALVDAVHTRRARILASAGMATVCGGVAMLHPPAAVILAGVCLLICALAATR